MTFDSLSDVKLETTSVITDSHQLVFISTTDEISSEELKKELKGRIAKREFPPGTIFEFVFGFHHGEGGVVGQNDTGLFRFHQMVISQLMNFCGNLNCKKCKAKKCRSEPSVWEEMDYSFNAIPIFTEGKFSKIELSEMSKDVLKRLGQRLCDLKKPSVLILGSCFSIISSITEVLRANGIVAAFEIDKDKSEVTFGNLYQLDKSQKIVIEKFGNGKVRKTFSLLNHYLNQQMTIG